MSCVRHVERVGEVVASIWGRGVEQEINGLRSTAPRLGARPAVLAPNRTPSVGICADGLYGTRAQRPAPELGRSRKGFGYRHKLSDVLKRGALVVKQPP